MQPQVLLGEHDYWDSGESSMVSTEILTKKRTVFTFSTFIFIKRRLFIFFTISTFIITKRQLFILITISISKVRMDISEIIMHADYDSNTVDQDFALLKMARKVRLS